MLDMMENRCHAADYLYNTDRPHFEKENGKDKTSTTGSIFRDFLCGERGVYVLTPGFTTTIPNDVL